MSRRRLDEELVAHGLAVDLSHASTLIRSRTVLVDGAPGLKPGTLVPARCSLTVTSPRAFVSRGGFKLHGALLDLAIDVTGLTCLDAGAGSGGFTDCLLKAGAAGVVAVDVGYGQFDFSLRRDPRVSLLERTNIRSLSGRSREFDLIVADLSFVSLTCLADTFRELAEPGARCLLLVKPQFEAAVSDVGPGGIVTDPAIWKETVRSVAQALHNKGMGTLGVVPSRLKGAGGNQEFFLLAAPGAAGDFAAIVQGMGAGP